jgi:putative glutamine amidotransferase
MVLPLIGLTLDAEHGGGYSRMPWYALRENYFDSVREAGGLPIAIPHFADDVDAYLDLIKGLLVTGGAFDVDPALYGEAERHSTVQVKDKRTAFEYAITKRALERNIPILGICGGEQLLNVALGGTLIQHIPDSVESALEHEQPTPRCEVGHIITVTKGTLLHEIVGSDTLAVNTAHHQAVKTVRGNTVINAYAPDGVIEGVEDRSYKFCLGVQWHPEYHVCEGDKRIMQAFVAAAAQ